MQQTLKVKMVVRYREVFFKGNVQSGPEDGVRYREVSAIKCPLYRGSLRNQSVPEKSVRYREVSAIKGVRYREVPLYVYVY